MKFKEFIKWCNERACDGCWEMNTAMVCISIVREVRSYPFWKREKIWKRDFEDDVVNNIVIPIENKIKEINS